MITVVGVTSSSHLSTMTYAHARYCSMTSQTEHRQSPTNCLLTLKYPTQAHLLSALCMRTNWRVVCLRQIEVVLLNIPPQSLQSTSRTSDSSILDSVKETSGTKHKSLGIAIKLLKLSWAKYLAEAFLRCTRSVLLAWQLPCGQKDVIWRIGGDLPPLGRSPDLNLRGPACATYPTAYMRVAFDTWRS